jgi:hypothetical protein
MDRAISLLAATAATVALVAFATPVTAHDGVTRAASRIAAAVVIAADTTKTDRC